MRTTSAVLTVFIFLWSTTADSEPFEHPDVDDVYPIVPDWQELTILHIGDSHVSAGLKTTLKKILKDSGGHYVADCWVGSRSKSWVTSGRLKQLLKKHNPEVVIVTLGTNIIKNHKPHRHSGWVHALSLQLGKRICYWLGPPPLLDDLYGLNAMLKTNSKPCRYFDARILDIEKRADGKFHLSKHQGESWAEKVWLWMNGKSFE